MPELTRDFRRLEHLWDEQQLLDPPLAQKTLETIETGLSAVEPELSALRQRQDAISRELQELVKVTRGD
jgi:hypothetical protein